MESAGGASCRGIVAVIPAYNEERFIGSVVLKARQYADTVVVVDDGSTDATGEIAQAAGAIVVRHDHNRGKGAALNTGLRKAWEVEAEAVALLDGDWQHRPDDIPQMIRPVVEGQADMVVGSRYLGLESRAPAHRRLGQHVVTLITSVLTGVPSTDSLSGFRAFSRRALECVHFRESGWGVDPEFQFQAREHGLKVAEVPIVALYDDRAKRNPLAYGLKTVNGILRLVGQHRPLLFFSGSGTLILAAGIVAGLWVVNVYNVSRVLAIGIALVSVLLSVIGMLTLFTGIILHSVRGLILEFTRSNRYDE